MRMLAPIFAMTSIVALAGGTAFANTDKSTQPTPSMTTTPSPTVSANPSGAADLSYSDKSNTSPGTNAVMDPAKSAKGVTMPDNTAAPAPVLTAEEKAALKAKKKAKKTVARNDAVSTKTPTTMSSTDKVETNPTTPATNPAAAQSTGGRSQGQ